MYVKNTNCSFLKHSTNEHRLINYSNILTHWNYFCFFTALQHCTIHISMQKLKILQLIFAVICASGFVQAGLHLICRNPINTKKEYLCHLECKSKTESTSACKGLHYVISKFCFHYYQQPSILTDTNCLFYTSPTGDLSGIKQIYLGSDAQFNLTSSSLPVHISSQS